MSEPQTLTLNTKEGTVTIDIWDDEGQATVSGGLSTVSTTRFQRGDSFYHDSMDVIESTLLALVSEGITDKEALENAVNTTIESVANHSMSNSTPNGSSKDGIAEKSRRVLGADTPSSRALAEREMAEQEIPQEPSMTSSATDEFFVDTKKEAMERAYNIVERVSPGFAEQFPVVTARAVAKNIKGGSPERLFQAIKKLSKGIH